MHLKAIMNDKVATIRADATAQDAWERLQADKIHHLVVLDEGIVVGVLSERDLGGRNGTAIRNGATVAERMARHVVTARPDTSIKQAANLMRGRNVGCLPVMENGRLKGIVTVSDLLDLLGHGFQNPSRVERAVLSRRRDRERRGPF